LKKSEKPNILGVILDADKDVNARYQNIKSKAKDKNFYQNLPDSMPKTGLRSNTFLFFCLLYYLIDKINIYIGCQFQIKLCLIKIISVF
jgi:hypothetical protein